MKKIYAPVPIDEEIKLNPFKTIMSKTDKKGVIEYANDYFMEICGYKEWELMGQPHNVIRHPDMPKIIFKLLWNRLSNGQNIHAAVKNLAKDGRYYWVITDFQIKYDEYGDIKALYSRRKAIPQNVKEYFTNLYAKLLKIENVGGIEASGIYLKGLLDDAGMTYDEFILDIMGLSEKELLSYMKAQISDEELDQNYYSAEELIKKKKKKNLFKRIFS
jgi:PAS domain S-box-containing protein